MCGIAGRLTTRGARGAEDWRDMAIRLQRALAHRGPDDQGAYLSRDGRAGLVHCRLSILDLSAGAHQPMVIRDGRYALTFNGEIYNFRQLRRELEDLGETFVSSGDTEVILRGYARYGRRFLGSLRGMFALCLWDDETKTALLARDPLGIKPLYYQADAGQLLFASELQALLALGQTARRLSVPALQEYLLFGSVGEPQTLIEGIQMLPAGQWLEWCDGKVTGGTFWELPRRHEAMSGEQAINRVRTALIESVTAHLVSDVPVGVFLSGGVDSTLLLGQVAAQSRSVQTFSIGFEEAGYSETNTARRTAEHFGSIHHERILTARAGRELVADFIARGDQPSIDGFNTFCVAKLARDHGAKVVLSGVGGDEIFAGYPSFDRMPRWYKMAQLAQLVPAGLRRLVSHWGQGTNLAPRYRRVLSMLANSAEWGNAYWCQRGIFTPEEVAELSALYLGRSGEVTSALPPYEVPFASMDSDREIVSRYELTRYLRHQLLRDSDMMSMGWSLELRTPFVDAHFLEAVMAVPARYRLAPKKQMLLDAFPELPPWVVDQPKRGFVFPFQKWMEHEWRDLLQQIDTASPVRAVTWSRRWALFSLNQFIQRHKLEALPLGGVA